MHPYEILMGDYNDDILPPSPIRPWQKGLADSELLDPLLAASKQLEAGQYYTHIPRRGRPHHLDAILMRH